MATLVYCDADGVSARYQLRGKEILIGQTDECAIRSDDSLVAPRHARLFEQAGEYWIEDLGSVAGVFIGTEQVSQSRVPFGTVILVGSLALRIDPENDQNGVPLFDHGQLIAQLAATTERRRKLEEERNALGKRVGELHQELREARASTEVDDGEDGTREPTSPIGGGFAPEGVSLEQLAGELQKAEAARRDIEKKIALAERRRAQTSSEVTAAEEAESTDADPSEIEVRQVQILSLRAQLAEADYGVERLRSQLAARNAEIAALRQRARREVAPSATKEYSFGEDESTGSRLADVKARFEAEFERAVTLQRKLKTAEQRITELEESQSKGSSDAASMRQRVERLSAEKAILQGRVETLEGAAAGSAAPAEDGRVQMLESKVKDLQTLLEGARRETNAIRTKLGEEKSAVAEAEARSTELENEIADGASESIKRDERIAALEKKLIESDGRLASKDRELTELAAAVAISAEADSDREALEKKLARLELELANFRSAVERAESARNAAFAARRELESRVIGAESGFKENQAKLDHLERKAAQAKEMREKAEAQLTAVKADLVEAREARLAAEEALNTKRQKSVPVGENSQVISLRRRLSENQDEMATELERLEARIRELETDLDRALDAERAALARVDIEQAALQSKIDRLASARDELTAELETLRPELEAVTARADAAAERVVELEASLKENHVTVDRVDELESDLHGLRLQSNRAKALEASLEEARTTAAQQAKRMAALEEELVAAGKVGVATVDLRARVVELASQNARMSSEMSGLSEDHEAAVTRATALEEELEQTRIELRKLGAERQSIESAHHDLTRRYDNVSADLRQTADDLDTLRRQTDPDATAVSEDAAELAREVLTLRDRVAELEAAMSAGDVTSVGEIDEPTSTGLRVDTLSDVHEHTTPLGASIAVVEWMARLKSAVTELRRAMRTASDEAAMMAGGGDSVEVINNALSVAIERVETARDAIRRLGQILDC